VIANLPALLERDALFVRELLDRVGLARRAGFVAFDVVAGEEDSVAWDDLAGLEEGDVANDDVL
jgi:hypothetical protein